MTIQEFFELKYQSLGVGLSGNQLQMMLVSGSLDPGTTITSENLNKIEIAFLKSVSDLLLIPDITEGDLAIKYDRKSLLLWYSAESSRLGVENPFASDQVKDMSHLA